MAAQRIECLVRSAVVTKARLELTRAQIVAFRRRVSALDKRMPSGAKSLRIAVWAGLQDSMPRAALLSIHARVKGTKTDTWEDRNLVQVWGPRYSAYVIAEGDRALFTVARLPDEPSKRSELERLADRIEVFTAGRHVDCREVGRGLARHPVSLRYAAPTGRLLIRWDGARQPTIWTVPAPATEPADARADLARRYLRVFGPATGAAFGDWAGVRPARGRKTFDALADALAPVRTPVGDGWILAEDEKTFRSAIAEPAPARLLPAGDTFTLLKGVDRLLLVPDAAHRAALWTPRVWPGAVLVKGEVAGTWRRAGALVVIDAWRRLARSERDAVEQEAQSFPLPGIAGEIGVRWEVS
jgi:hypothetical protein